MSGHTPGEWAAEDQCSESGWVTIIATSADRLPVGYVTPAQCGDPNKRRDDETKANARLIAAAPELLDMLIEARKEFAGLPHSLGYDFTHLPKLDALIAKATGTQP